MTRLVPNPIGELTGPLTRTEHTLAEVRTTLQPVGELTRMADDIAAMRTFMETLVGEMAELRRELAARAET